MQKQGQGMQNAKWQVIRPRIALQAIEENAVFPLGSRGLDFGHSLGKMRSLSPDANCDF